MGIPGGESPEKKPFEAQKFLTNFFPGDPQIVGIGENGNANVKFLNANGEEEIKSIDIRRAFRQQAISEGKELEIDPNREIQFNSPDSAFEGDVDFTTGLQLAGVKRPEDKQRILAKRYGEENVAEIQGTEGPEFKIKVDGAWRSAEPSFLESIGSKSPAIAAGIIGGSKAAAGGASVGMVVAGPPGAAVIGFGSLIVGGALSAALAQGLTDESLEIAGIKTDEDADHAMREMGKEFVNNTIWGMGLGAAGKLLKPLIKGGSKVIKRAFNNFFDKETIAETATKMIPGTNIKDWMASVKSVASNSRVHGHVKQMIKWRKNFAEGKVTGTDPMTDRMIRLTVGSMRRFKKTASDMYDRSMDRLEQSGVFKNSPVNIRDPLQSMRTKLEELGLVDKAGNFVQRVADARKAGVIDQVYGASNKKAIGEVYETLQRFGQRNRTLPFKEARKVLRKLDDILESTGQFKNNLEISDQARRVLRTTRHDLRQEFGKALDKKFVKDASGKTVDAKQFYNDATERYSQFRNSYDDFAVKLGKGDDKKVFDTVNRMLGDQGFALEDTFGQMAKSVGSKGNKILERLQELRAGRNLSSIYAPSQTGTGTVIQQITFGGIKSPREGIKTAGGLVENAEALAGFQRSPLGKAGKTALKAAATTVDFLNKLPLSGKVDLLSNPNLLRPLLKGTILSPEEQAQQNEGMFRELESLVGAKGPRQQ